LILKLLPFQTVRVGFELRSRGLQALLLVHFVLQVDEIPGFAFGRWGDGAVAGETPLNESDPERTSGCDNVWRLFFYVPEFTCCLCPQEVFD
jgi:hypothetical protein